MKRRIEPVPMPDIVPGKPETGTPYSEWVSPTDLLVDEDYQRNLSERSIKLIRKIVGCWDWRRFKPPIVVSTGEGFEVIDGQHTAIAAASHPDVTKIPVMIVDAPQVSDRAKAFIGHNRDRLQITKTQMHHAAVAAGDEDALTVELVCKDAGVRILRVPPGHGVFKPRDTMAVAAIDNLVRRLGRMRARQVMQVLADAECAPIRAEAIKAVEHLMTQEEYKGQFLPADLTLRIRSMDEEAYREAKILGISHKMPLWRSLAVVWFKGVKRVRRAA